MDVGQATAIIYVSLANFEPGTGNKDFQYLLDLHNHLGSKLDRKSHIEVIHRQKVHKLIVPNHTIQSLLPQVLRLPKIRSNIF